MCVFGNHIFQPLVIRIYAYKLCSPHICTKKRKFSIQIYADKHFAHIMHVWSRSRHILFLCKSRHPPFHPHFICCIWRTAQIPGGGERQKVLAQTPLLTKWKINYRPFWSRDKPKASATEKGFFVKEICIISRVDKHKYIWTKAFPCHFYYSFCIKF